MHTSIIWIYSQALLEHGSVWHDTVNRSTVTEEEHKSELVLTKATPYPILTGELWSVCCKNLLGNWLHYDIIAVQRIAVESKPLELSKWPMILLLADLQDGNLVRIYPQEAPSKAQIPGPLHVIVERYIINLSKSTPTKCIGVRESPAWV